MPRSAFHVSAAALVLLTGASSVDRRHHPMVSLRIEALGQNRLSVRVSTIPESQKWIRKPNSEVIVEPPAVVPIADSIQSVRVVVIGLGSVRVILTDSTGAAKRPLIAVGRDLTLSRDAQGRFFRAWTVQPLVP